MNYSSIIAAVIGILVSFAFGFLFVPMLKKLKFGQTIREEGPSWHAKKDGTPTMGGILIILGTLLALLITIPLSLVFGNNVFSEHPLKTLEWIAALGLAISMGFIGFIDDYIKVVKKRNLGLTARQKTFLQLLVSAAFLATLALSGLNSTYIPFVGNVDVTSGVGLIFWPVSLVFIYGFTNAVNLTDGVDGLATSVTIVVSCAFLLLAGIMNCAGANVFASALTGALIGFLIWNCHPAKVFMGDTGSLFLGGAVAGLSFAVGCPIILILLGLVYFLEALSVIIQVTHYKRTKKRIFKMTPIHHHFEMCGWSEDKIVFVFSLVTLVFSVIGCLLIILSM